MPYSISLAAVTCAFVPAFEYINPPVSELIAAYSNAALASLNLVRTFQMPRSAMIILISSALMPTIALPSPVET